jgi:glucosyl-3-phosphoglycerate synthase
VNLADLVAAKRALGHSISVCLPARNEAATIGAIVHEVSTALTDPTNPAAGLVDEVVVIDDGSTDATAEIARGAGALVVAEAGILPEAGPGSGKGNALWKSLQACRGDLLCWVDADLRNFGAATVTRLLEPLITDADTVLVKASYARSFEGAPTGGGRVTELVARPLLSLLFPKLADIVQPLGGEYAARRDALAVLPFVEGWGVELGLLVDVVERYGRDAVAQVDLGTREHRNRPVDELAAQSLAIMATALRRAGLMHFDAPTLELLRTDLEGNIDAELVEIRERPPIATFPAYRARHN